MNVVVKSTRFGEPRNKMDAQQKQNLTLALKELEEDSFAAFVCAEEANSYELAQIIYSVRKTIKKGQRYLSNEKIET